ncbi:hypothetical protein [Streptomyces sp. SID161]|uniref:hypothetical protein n=1 Tax=Streptomyces sp. SID161 TaxID=2690251 RepID=UPI001370BDA6|nr:hypothetical protein [Streptomyces sp. SID161]MYW43058.1 hypothetical protein [Streptomyces sp. SID161]
MAQLAATVYVKDPDTHQTVRLEAGTSPEARLAALVTNPTAWVDGKLPRLPKTKQDDQEQLPTGDGQDDASGDDSASDGDADKAAPAAKKTAAKKTAASSRSRGRDAADEGTSGD